MSFGRQSSDSAGLPGSRESDLGATYFPFLGPSPLDTHDTSFAYHHHPGRPAQQVSSPGVNTTDRLGGGNRRDAESVHSSPSEPADDNIVSVPGRYRPFPPAQSLVLMAPHYSPFAQPGFSPLTPPFAPLGRTLSDDSTFIRRRTNSYQHMQHMGLKHVVIFAASLFLLALVAAVFTAVYFGHKLDSRSRV